MPSAAPSPQISLPAKPDMIGYGLAIGGATLFSAKGIFIKLAFIEGASTEIVLAMRMLVALPVYLVILTVLLRRQPRLLALLNGRTVLGCMLVGCLGYYLSSYLDFAGLAFVSAQYERLVLFTYPFLVLIFGVLFFGDRMDWRLVPPMLLTYAGLLVIFAWNMAVEPDGLLIGTALVLTSAVTFALYQHLARRQMRIVGAGLFTCIGMIPAALLAIGQSLLVDGATAYGELTPLLWFYGLMLGIVCTVIPSFLINAAISRIGPRGTSATASFGPIVTIALAVWVLGETFTPFHAVGTIMVLVGTSIFARRESRSVAAANNS